MKRGQAKFIFDPLAEVTRTIRLHFGIASAGRRGETAAPSEQRWNFSAPFERGGRECQAA
jgi:hypothetical protein